MFSEQIKKESNLPSAMIQCCFDSASWMWRGYREQLKDWNWELKRAKGEWRKKLLKRTPQKPFSKGMKGKVPIWFDYRIGSIERSRIKLCSYVARASTLRKGVKITIPLNPARYHLDLWYERPPNPSRNLFGKLGHGSCPLTQASLY